MIFNSFTYLIFLPLVVVAYWQLPRRGRHALLFGSSLLFYGFWRFDYLLLLLATITIDFYCALRISDTPDARAKWRWLALSVGVNIGMLLYFKYTIFFVDNLNGIGRLLGVEEIIKPWSILLPVGISFYVFQQVAYIIDVYRGHFQPVREYMLYGAFVTYFPQLVAGPILRPNELVPQFNDRPIYCSDDIARGGWMILHGLFLKCVMADNIAPFVDNGFTVAPSTLSAPDVWVLACLFGFQIYFDFAAYSQIALGSARLMGICFPDNFNFPYLATSPRDFWRRWHISLSSWIRDYLYLPLCGVRPRGVSTGGLEPVESVGIQRRTIALVATWGIMGLWHGASWNFAFWGLWHAALILGHRWLTTLSSPILHSRLAMGLGTIASLGLIMLGWIFFRASSVDSALLMLGKAFNPWEYLSLRRGDTGGLWSLIPINIDPLAYLAMTCCIVGMVAIHLTQKYIVPRVEQMDTGRLFLTVAYGAGLTAAVLVYLRPARQFIYFQF